MIVGYINGQSLEIHHTRVVADSVDYLTADFVFQTNEWDGFTKYVHFANGKEHYKIELTGDKILKKDHLNLTSGIWQVYIHGVLSTEVITTNRCTLSVESTGDISGGQEAGGAVQEAVKQAQEEYRAELEASLETATGEDQDGKTWDELKDTVATLPIATEEQTQALNEWDLIKEYFANHTGKDHDLFKVAPGGSEYNLPYLYTPKMTWSSGSLALSTNLIEVGVDVSKAVGVGGDSQYRTFSPLPKLKRLTLTGNENLSSLHNFMRGNSSLEYIKMDTPNEKALVANPSYYKTAFYSCSNLRTIDCELDFTGQTSMDRPFSLCYKLKDLRIKPFTLSTSLDLGDCQNLHHNDLYDYESLISVLNAITLDQEAAKNITITFNSAITDFTVGMTQYWNKLVYFREGSRLYYPEPPDVTGDEAYIELTLYDAFVSKGVTIAWP